MDFSLEIVDPPGCAVITWCGPLVVDNLVAVTDAIKDAAYSIEIARLWDCRSVAIDLTTERVRQLTQQLAAIDREQGPRLVSVLVAGDVDFGVTRQFMAFADQFQADYYVSRDLDAAKDWVGLPKSYVLPVDR